MPQFFTSPKPEGTPLIYTIYRRSFRVINRRRCEVIHLHLDPNLGISGAINQLPLHSFREVKPYLFYNPTGRNNPDDVIRYEFL
jgi:GT2 family glycosyltransferase